MFCNAFNHAQLYATPITNRKTGPNGGKGFELSLIPPSSCRELLELPVTLKREPLRFPLDTCLHLLWLPHSFTSQATSQPCILVLTCISHLLTEVPRHDASVTHSMYAPMSETGLSGQTMKDTNCTQYAVVLNTLSVRCPSQKSLVVQSARQNSTVQHRSTPTDMV